MISQGTIDAPVATEEPAVPVPAKTRIRPSSLPALEQCPAFHADETERDYTTAGTARHKVLASALASEAGADAALDALPPDDREGVLWALDYVRMSAATEFFPLELEQRREFVGPDFVTYGGTLDVRCGPDIFDMKWRWGRYLPQQAAYALTIMPPLPKARVHLLFAATKRAKTYDLDAESAEAIVHPIIEAATAPNPEPKPCDYCGWCAKRLTCKAISEGVQAAFHGRGDWGLRSWHSAEMQDPRELAKAFRIARRLKEWCESVEFAAKDAAFKRGVTLPGFEAKTRRGALEVSDVRQAFQLVGLPEEEFWKAVDVRLNAAKGKVPRPGLVELYAAHHSISREGAKREIVAKLGEAVKARPPARYLEDVEDDPDAVE